MGARNGHFRWFWGLGTPNPPFVLFGPENGLFKLPKHYVLKGKWPAKNTIKQGKTRQKDKWYPFHACTGGGVWFFIENPRRGGFSQKGVGVGHKGAGGGLRRIWGGGANFFFSGPKCPPSKTPQTGTLQVKIARRQKSI